LAGIYPQKYQYVGETALRSLVIHGAQQAVNNGISTNPGISLYIALMFAFGCGFTRDPRIPWVEKILKNPGLQDPDDKAKCLYEAMMTYFKEKLADFDRSENRCV
jgi:hypothetical protein